MRAGKLGTTFICLWAIWLVLTASTDLQEILVGGIIAFIVALPSHQLLFRGDGWKKITPSRMAHALAYLPYYIWAEIKAHANVIYRIVHPKMPIKPGIVKVPIKMKTDFGVTTVADSITMTPGTLSVDVGNGAIYVHWINVTTVDPEETGKKIAGGLERFIGGIFG